MGLFSRKHGEREAILQHRILAQSSSCESSAQTENVSFNNINIPRKKAYRLRHPFKKRTKSKKTLKFARLLDRGPSPSSNYVPPAGFFLDPVATDDGSTNKKKKKKSKGFMQHSPIVVIDSKGRVHKKKTPLSVPQRLVVTQDFQRIESVDSEITDSSSAGRFSYQPPGKLSILPAPSSPVSKKKTKQTMPKSAPRRLMKKEFQRVKSADSDSGGTSSTTRSTNEYQPPNFDISLPSTNNDYNSVGEFDVRSNTHSLASLSRTSRSKGYRRQSLPGSLQILKPVSSNKQNPKKKEEDGLEFGQEDGPEFRQFVFDSKFKKIEKVTVAKSDAGASDFSDFVEAAARLNQKLAASRCDRSQVSAKSHSSQQPKKKTTLRPPTPTENTDPSPRSQVSILLEKEKEAKQFPVFSAMNLALSQQLYAPLKTNSTVSSVVSNAGATITSSVEAANAPVQTVEVFSENNNKDIPFPSLSEDESDPFKSAGWLTGSHDSAWMIPPPPPPPPQQRTNGTKKTAPRKTSSSVDPDALILSIMKAASRESDSTKKPDPSPTRIHMTSSDSLLQGLQLSTISSTKQLIQPTNVPESKSDGALEPNSIGPQKKPPKGLPSNAILGSMLFRQTFSDESDSQYGSKENDNHQNDDDKSAIPGKVPPNIQAEDKAESTVSSVTEEASSFAENAFDGNQSGWNKQAHNVLDQWRKVQELKSREESVLIHQVPNQGRATQEHLNMFTA